MTTINSIHQATVQKSGFVHDMVRARAEQNPSALAIVEADGTEISYSELVRRCDHLAARIRSHGVGRDEPVIVQLGRSSEAIVAMVAVMQAGGAYTPVDSLCPAERFATIVRGVGARWLLVNGQPPAEVSAIGARVMGESGTGSGLPTVLHPEDLAYILHTSGSTGVPKSVAMSHQGLTRLIRWQVDDNPHGLSTAVFTAMSFDVTFQEIFSTLITGGCLHILSESDRRDPERLIDTLTRRSIERIFLPYVALQQLAKAAQRLGRVPSALRQVVTAGEQLVITDTIASLFDALPGCRLDNHYGPTEAHLVTRWTANQHNRPWPTMAPIGMPVYGAEVRLLNEELEPVPAGEPGEIFIGGEAIARGYAGAPGLTAERFLPDPFQSAAGARMYRTGDLAWLDPGGYMHFLGRTDGQVKVRGYRVEPGEVEAVLSGHEQVRAVAVGVRQLGDEVTGLVAYVVPETKGVTAAELSSRARAALPAYMVPARYVFLDALPLTDSGKVDRSALAGIALPMEAPIESADSTVETVAAIWRRVLGHDEFSPDDDFFEIGGDSLLAGWVAAELSQVAGRALKLSVLLEDSTVEGLAAALSKALGDNPPERHSRSEIVTLRVGRANRNLFFFHALGGELFAYRELARRLDSPLRVLGVRWAAGSYGHLALPELARIHADQIRAVQPQGSYLLAGWSFGGTLAFEVARQLSEDGGKVGFLGLLDASPALDPISGLPRQETTYADTLTRMLDHLDRHDAEDGPTDLSAFTGGGDWARLMGGAVPEGLSVRHIRRHLELSVEGLHAVMKYRPQQYSGAVDLFQADASRPAAQAALAFRLREVTDGPVRIHPVPGDHMGILRGHGVTILAQAIDEALLRVAKGVPDRE